MLHTGSSTLQRRGPVEHHRDRRGSLALRGGGDAINQKPLPVRRHIVTKVVESSAEINLRIEKSLRSARFELGRRLYIHCHQSGVGAEKEDFLSIPAPSRLRAARGRHLKLAGAGREGLNEHLV